MADIPKAVRAQLDRQVAHWTAATLRLHNLDELASPAAWAGLEQYMGVAIRRRLAEPIDRLQRQAALLRAEARAAESVRDLVHLRRRVLDFRRDYLRIETILDFYADAINTRTKPTVAAILRACDTLAYRSMAMVLDQLNRPIPPVMAYLDKGMGASILKAGLRLWDASTENPVAAIKITRHNLQRPTSLIHETGHQVAHILGWNNELASALRAGLEDASPQAARAWAYCASEVAADAFAFVHTGFAAVAALHDVLAGEEPQVFRYTAGDPHPISYVRVLLGVEMCRRFYGAGSWDDLGQAWIRLYPLERAGEQAAFLLRESLPLLPRIVAITLILPMRAFGGRALTAIVDPERVKPERLDALERELGPALYTSMHWVWTEALRLLALAGLRFATQPHRAVEVLKQQEEWMLRLGGLAQAA